MYLRLISILTVFAVSPLVVAQDGVTQWLKRMGCDELLAVYLEDQLEHGTKNTQVRAAIQLADVYAIMLARSDQDGDKELLNRAISLFDRISDTGSTELKLQLYRGTYIAIEQILERYRCRIYDLHDAGIAISQLREVVDNFDLLHKNLVKSVRSDRTPNEKKMNQLGLVTSYLAWAHYYIAWHDGDLSQASKAVDLFAEILLGERPSLHVVALDLKSLETGARAILGIALCKAILQDPEGPEPWFEELEDPATWSAVRQLVPRWKFFLHVDELGWDDVLQDVLTLENVNQTLLFRVAAAHALEHYSNSTAKEIAKHSLAGLVELGQLGIVSDLIKLHGVDALGVDGFISKYIEAEMEFRQLKETYVSDEPTKDEQIRTKFKAIAHTFEQAIQSNDVLKYPSLVDDCQFMLGLSFYYSSQFNKAATAFQRAIEGKNKEQSVWMAIVSLDYIESLSPEEQQLKDELSELYLEKWPYSHHATELTIHRSETEAPSSKNIEALLAIPHSDQKYEDAQRQASRSLYLMWQNTSSLQRASIGNKYVTIAVPLMKSDLLHHDDSKATEMATVRALRLLEVSLHPDVERTVAADRAIETIEEIEKRKTYALQIFQSEINFRKIQLHLLHQRSTEAANLLLEMLNSSTQDNWMTVSAQLLWNYWALEESKVDDNLRYLVGIQLLAQLKESQYAMRQYIGVASATAQSAFAVYNKNKDDVIGQDALRISRILFSQQPLILQILILNAEIEMVLGDQQVSLQHWKTIAEGSKRGSQQWLQARFHSILMLSVESKEDAIAVLNQHHVMYPNYGQEPYGSKLRSLHNQLRGGNLGS